MTIDTRTLDKSRPPELKGPRGVDAYFIELERILAKFSRELGGSTGPTAVNNSLFQSSLDELRAALTDMSPNLTADSASITADTTYISADIA